MSAVLLFGGFQLNLESATPERPWKTKTLAQGTSRGNPEPIEVTVESWLRDGAIVVTQGYTNREMLVNVKITGEDQDGLAAGEAALFGEVGKPNLLSWTPNAALAKTAVFVVITSSLKQADDRTGADVASVEDKPSAVYGLRLVCEAFVRSKDEITVPALPASGSVTTLVDNGSATTGWTATLDGVSVSPVVSSGAVGHVSAALPGTTVTALTRTGAISTSATPFLVIDYKPTAGGFVYPHLASDLRAYGDGVELARVAHTALAGGLYRATFYAPAASIAALRLELTVRSSEAGATTARTFLVDNINRTDARPFIGTARQLVRAFEVLGSARTPANITLEHPTDALGDVLVYVWPGRYGTYLPALRSSYRTSGGTVAADATKVSGGREDLENGQTLVLDIPQVALPPGTYVLLARAGLQLGTLAATLTWTAQSRINSTDVGSPVTGSSRLALTTTYGFYALGRLQLPVTDVGDRSTATTRLSITNVSGAATHPHLDEVWLFNTTIGQLLQVACGTGAAASGGPSRRLFVRPATVDIPRPRVLRGHAADLSDAFYASPDAWMNPILEPGEHNIFTVTTNTTDAAASVRYFPQHFARPTV